MKKLGIILLTVPLWLGNLTQGQTLLPGDLLFYEDSAGMGAAIRESTGHYTHVAMIESVGDTIYIIDATQRYGVSRRPFLRQLNDDRPYPTAYRLTIPFDTAVVIAHARSFVGQPYDNAFLPDNGALYCSELIYECYLDTAGRHLFEAQPMNFRNKQGRMPHYWKKHFKRLGIKVPEGILGTNPTDMSRSPLLHKL